MNRRSFLIRVGGTLVAVPTVLSAVACGGGDDGGGGGGADASTGQTSFSVMNSDASGHSHQLVIQCSDLSGSGVSYTATGGHTHTVMISQSELGMISSGSSVTINTTDGHAHTWIISKPSGAC